MTYSLQGLWEVELDDGTRGQGTFPGSLDENGIGHKDFGANQWHPDAELGNSTGDFDEDAPIATRFTRKNTFEGVATFKRKIDFVPESGKRVFLRIERARSLNVFVDEAQVSPFITPSLSTENLYELTGLIKKGSELVILSDNGYQGLPKEDILYSSAATDETQTNWNGLLGDLCLYEKPSAFIKSVRFLSCGKTVKALAIINSNRLQRARLSFYGECFCKPGHMEGLSLREGDNSVVLELPLPDRVKNWDIQEPILYFVETVLEAEGCDRLTTEIGIRSFEADTKGNLLLNGRKIFLRGETNCGVFPETGYEPTDVDTWIKIMKQYRDYGVNCVRFHSHCPPEAAFIAADKVGLLMMPELSDWNPKDAFHTKESREYYRGELRQILLQYGNHPSFVMLTLGNELFADEAGHLYMEELLNMARKIDGSRLYANGSNVHYGAIGCDPGSDFYLSQAWHEHSFRGTSAGAPQGDEDPAKYTAEPIPIQGYINNQYPNAKTDFSRSLNALREEYDGPVIGFETGQYEVLPDFDEIESFSGVTDPVNYRLIRQKVEEKNLLGKWKKYVEASGELALLCYREEVEAALRTEGFSGTTLLGLQDFPGQGTALVGMLNAHLTPKPYSFAKPERFERFFRDKLPLVLLEKYTYWESELLKAELKIANYGKMDLAGDAVVKLVAQDGTVEAEMQFFEVCVKAGSLRSVGTIGMKLPSVNCATRYNLKVTLQQAENSYPIWVYPREQLSCPKQVYETEVFDEKAVDILKEGGRVLLAPVSCRSHFPKGIKGQFSTDFWSVGTFSRQEGGMGQYIDVTHPIFEKFPTEFHTNWQWHLMASQYAVELPDSIESIVTELDSYAYLRNMGQLVEVSCGGGLLMISTMGLKEHLDYPEANALLNCIYEYMAGDRFAPSQTMEPEQVREMIVS